MNGIWLPCSGYATLLWFLLHQQSVHEIEIRRGINMVAFSNGLVA